MSSTKMITVFSLLALFCTSAIYANPIQPDPSGFLKLLKDLGDSLTREQKDQLKAIATNPASTKQQVVDGLQNFFHSIGGDAENKYNAFMAQVLSEAKKLEEAVKAEEPSMSPEEKAFVEKANDINANMGITYAENAKQIQDLIASASPEMTAKMQGDIKKLIDAAQKQQQQLQQQ